MRTPFVGGNWKMNTDRASAEVLAAEVARDDPGGVEVALFVPFPFLLTVRDVLQRLGSNIVLGAQDAWHQANGAFTGEISIAMLRDCGVGIVLTGHSERRHIIGESDDLVGLKTAAVLREGLRCVLCVGETIEERRAGRTDEVNRRQLVAGLKGVERDWMERLVIAYEPVWAIGTGVTAQPSQAQESHERIRGFLKQTYSREIAEGLRIIYGGSVTPDNARELFDQPDIDGGLIGGASLDAGKFTRIVQAAASGSDT